MQATAPQKRRKILHKILKTLTLYQWALLYFTTLSFIGGGIISSLEGIAFTDGWFVATSAVCVTGLSSVDFGKFGGAAQVVTLILIQLGGLVFFTLFPVIVRRYQLKRKYLGPRREFIEQREQETELQNPAEPPGSVPGQPAEGHHEEYIMQETTQIRPDEVQRNAEVQRILKLLQKPSTASEPPDINKEYRAICKLLKIIPMYIIVIELLGFLLLGFYLQFSTKGSNILRQFGNQNAWWWALFHAFSAFNNAGFSLFSESLIPFGDDGYVLIVLSFLIFLGVTAYPIVLRGIIWALQHISRDKVPYKYLLVRPRECYTHLFPAVMTRVLFLTWFSLWLSELVLFVALDWNNAQLVTRPPAQRLLAGYFQAATTRLAGFSAINIDGLQYGFLVYTCLMMYISIYPLAYSIRASDRTPAELRDPGGLELRYKRDIEAETVPRSAEGKRLIPRLTERPKLPSVINLLRWYGGRLALRDATWVFLAIFLISSIESNRIYSNPQFTLFRIIFETISAYGTVGLSLGFPNILASFSAVLSTASKVIITLIMVQGRLRGLPDSLDYAVIPRSSKVLANNLRARYNYLSVVDPKKIPLEKFNIPVEPVNIPVPGGEGIQRVVNVISSQ